MAFKAFLHKISDGIKHFFGGLKPKAKTAIAIGVKVTDLIKKAFDTQEDEILTALIPGDVDDNIAARIREALPNIMLQLQLASTCVDKSTPDAIVACAIETLKNIHPGFRKDFYDSLATQIALVAADGELDWDDLKSTIKWYNDNMKKQLPEPAGIK